MKPIQGVLILLLPPESQAAVISFCGGRQRRSPWHPLKTVVERFGSWFLPLY